MVLRLVKVQYPTIFKTLGIPVLDADVIAREVVMPGEEALADIVTTFGANMLQDDGTLNRAALGAKVLVIKQR